MDVDKYKRHVTLLCPTCAGTQFEHDDGADETLRCASCQRQMTKDELIRENAENLSENVKEIGEMIKDDVANELKRKFSGLKNIKIG